MTVPAVPGAGFVVVEAELVFGGLEPLFDPPARTFDLHQRLERCSVRAPCREIPQIAISRIAADQQAAGPCSAERIAIFRHLEIGHRAIQPVIPSFALGAVPGRTPDPGVLGQRLDNLAGLADPHHVRAPGVKPVIGIHAQHETFARAAQAHFQIADTIHTVTGNPGERHLCRQCPLDHRCCQGRLGGKADIVGHMRRCQPFRCIGPAFRQIQRPVEKGVSFG